MQPTTLLSTTVPGFFILLTALVAAAAATTAAAAAAFAVSAVAAVHVANVSAGENGLTKSEDDSSSSQPRGNVHRCTFRGHEYLPGEVWHANTSSPHCVLCTCLTTGKLNCTNLDCCDEDGNSKYLNSKSSGDDDDDEDEEDDDGGGVEEDSSSSSSSSTSMLTRKKAKPKKKKSGGGMMMGLAKTDSEGINACCKQTCKGRREGGEGGRSSSSSYHAATIQTISQQENRDSNSHYYDEETDDDPLVKANQEHVSCLHQGKIYRDQDSFASDLSGLPISSRAWDQCMHCVCQGGMVLCTLKSCSDFDCGKIDTSSSSSTVIMEACCSKCGADRQSVNVNNKKKAAAAAMVVDGGSGAVAGSSEAGGGQKPKSVERSGDMNDIADAQYLYTSITTNEENGVNAVASFSASSSSSLSSSSSSSTQEAPKHFILNHRLLATSSKRAGCVSAGKHKAHGSTWHPMIGPFGTMECVVCKCLHSRIECSRLPCPSATELQCSNLVKLEGHCCPTCATGVSPALFNDGESSKQLCVPIHQDVTVYKSHEYFSGNETEVTRLSFVRVKTGNWSPKFQVEVHEWTLSEGGKIFRFYTTYYTFNDFVNVQNTKTSIILGATSTRNLEKFTKREKKLHFRCKAHCNVRIQSLLLTLRLHELVAKTKCSSMERSVKNSV